MLAITPRVVRTNGPQTAIRRLLRPARVSVLVEALTRNLSAAPGAASASSPQGWSYYCVECLSPYARGRASPYFPSEIRASRLGLGRSWTHGISNLVLPQFACRGVVVLGRDEHIGGTSLLAESRPCPSASYL